MKKQQGFLLSLQLQVIITAILTVSSFGGGYYVSTKFHQASDYNKLKKVVDQVAIDAQTKLTGLHNSWKQKSKEQNDLLIAAYYNREADAKREAELLKNQETMQNELRKIGKRIAIADNVGVCRLDDQFIKLWNDLSRSARAGGTGSGSSNSTGSPETE